MPAIQEAARLTWHDLGKHVTVTWGNRTHSGVLLNLEHVTNGTEIMIAGQPDDPDTVFLPAGANLTITGKAS